MGLIYTLIIGLIAGALAKMITPQDEKGGWISSIAIGIVGSIVGHFLGGIIGISDGGLIKDIIISTGGAVLVLYIYHKYLAEQLNLPI
ncbi:MAG: GlsB/YeaQ/YmgE family stress response membrane protein [Phaeodactylibacter sp.]|nr:GlsB/YeaQ/YmgE family stress response membrane protein [Phaeodactylibacter sp.]